MAEDTTQRHTHSLTHTHRLTIEHMWHGNMNRHSLLPPLHPCCPPLSTPYHFDYFIIGSSNMLPSRFHLGCCLVPPCSMPPGHLHAGTHNDCEALLQSIILLLPLFLLEAIIFEAAILELPPFPPLSLGALAPSTLRLCVSKNKSFFCFCC